jgi:hypothetical protein
MLPRDSAEAARLESASTAEESKLNSSGLVEIGKYVYCLIKSNEDREFGPIGIGDEGSPVHTLRYGDLAAVVSDTPLRIYDPTRENVLAHEMVNNTVMEDFTVIPMSFGTMFRTDEDILALLESTSDALTDVLRKMENKIELGLKVLWDRQKVEARLEEEYEEIARLKEEAAGDGRESTYFAQVQLDRLLERTLEEKAAQYVTEIYESLVPLAVASRSNKVIGENMIMNVAFLVERDREGAFDAAVKKVASGYHDLLSFTYTGPWPPYNFVNIKLRLERADVS